MYLSLAVRRDADGYYYITNRMDDMIKVSGNMISPYEVENVVSEHPAVKECAVVSAPDPIKGHSIHLYVVLSDNFRKEIVREINKHGKLDYRKIAVK